MRGMKRLFLVFCLVGVLGFLSSQTWAAEKTPVKQLSQVPLSGKAGSFPETGWGILDAAEYVNQHGGVNGRTLEVILEDMQYDSAVSLRSYNRVLSEYSKKELLLHTGWHTGFLLANAKRVKKETHLACVDGSMSSAIFNENVRENFPYYFTMGLSYGDQVGFVYKYIKETLHKGKGKPNVAFVYIEGPAGRDPIKKMHMYAERFGINVVLEEPVTYTMTDYTPTMVKIRKSKAEYVFLWSFATPVSTRFLKAAKSYLPKTKILGMNYLGYESLFETAGKAVDNVYAICLYPKPHETDNPVVKLLLDTIKKKGRKVKVWDLYIECFVGGLICAEGAKRADKAGDLTREGIRTALENITDYKVLGLYNGKPLDYTYHCLSLARLVKADFSKKAFISVTDWIKVRDYVK